MVGARPYYHEVGVHTASRPCWAPTKYKQVMKRRTCAAKSGNMAVQAHAEDRGQKTRHDPAKCRELWRMVQNSPENSVIGT